MSDCRHGLPLDIDCEICIDDAMLAEIAALKQQVQAWKDACGLEQPHNLKKLCDGVQSLERELVTIIDRLQRERDEALAALRALQEAIAGDSVTTRLSVDVAQAMYKARAVLNRHPQPGQQEVPRDDI